MRDPLQKDPSPYELLGVRPGATPADIDKALRQALMKRGNVQNLMAAKNALQRPVDRALVELFEHSEDVLGKLRVERGDLEPPTRYATADQLQALLKASFPDLELVHALAVLWYWSAVSTSEGERSDAPHPADELWRRAIACWAMLVHSKRFWSARSSIDPETVPAVQSAVIDRLRNKLHDLSELQRKSNPKSTTYHDLEVAWSTELKVAKHAAAAKIRTQRGDLSCGPLMLESVGLATSVRQQIDAALAANPNDDLRALRELLSPVAAVAVLLDRNDPEGALDALKRLPASARSSPEAAELETRASLELAKRRASVGKIDEALTIFKSAMRGAKSEELKKKIRAEVVSIVQTRAAALQNKQRGEAIRIVEAGLEVATHDADLNRTLADLLTSEGIALCLEVQDQLKDKSVDPSPKMIETMKRGTALLDRAAKLGSKRAAEQAELAHGFLKQLESGFSGLSAETAKHVKAANEAAERGNWDAAVASLRAAVKASQPKEFEHCKKSLAAGLTNRAIDSANKATKQISTLKSPAEFLFEFLQSKFGDSHSCAMCAKAPGYGKWFTLNLPNGDTAQICEKCSEGVQKILTAPKTFTAEIAALLNSAWADVKEAIKLDPANDYVRKTKNDIDELMASIPSSAWPSNEEVRKTAKALGKTTKGLPRDYRHWVHVTAVTLVLIFVVIVGASALSEAPSKGVPMFVQFDKDVHQVLKAGGIGSVGVRIGQAIALPILGLIFIAALWSAGIVLTFEHLCARTWRNRNGFWKIAELTMFAAAILFVSAWLPIRSARSEAAAKQIAAKKPLPATPASPVPSPRPRGEGQGEGKPTTDRSWLTASKVPPEIITAELQRIQKLTPAQAEAEAAVWKKAYETASDEGRNAAQLLTAAAFERAGNIAEATLAYRSLSAAATPGSLYRGTATFYASRLGTAGKELETHLQKVAGSDQGKMQGWFFTGDHWELTSASRGALHSLMALHANDTSIKFLNWLREKSAFPRPYAYLFVLLSIAAVVKLIQLPFHVSSARLALRMPRLRPEVERIQRTYAGDATTLNQKILELYQREGVNPMAGCVKGLIDLGFVIWAILTLRVFAPQMALDGSRFWWVTNIGDRDAGVLALWAVATIVGGLLVTPQVAGRGPAIAGLFVIALAIAAAAWFWSWPAYVMIFWMTLSLLSLVVHFMTMGVLASRGAA